MIEQSSIENLKTRLNIVEVIEAYLSLSKNGVNYKCICPFHNDTKPSLVVSPIKQIYHCFACGAGGDSIKFVMEYEKLNYPEAIEKLASSINFTLSYTAGHFKNEEDKQILQKLNMWFKKNLINNQNAMHYIQNRQLTQNTINEWELGWSGDNMRYLDFLRAQNIEPKDALKVGALAFDNNRYYARFIDRITFPIHTPAGKIVGFGGRTISNHPAKYINSPATQFFNKSALLYGYDKAKKSIYKEKKIIITEGYLDTIMLHQAGFTCSVATLGTALTAEHVPLLKRGEPYVVLAYDGDSAGLEAAKRACGILSSNTIDGGVVIFSDSQDPADMVASGKTKELQEIFARPKNANEFIIEQIVKNYDITNPIQKEKALNEIKGFLATLSGVVAHSYESMVASLLHVDAHVIKLNNQPKNRPNTANSAPEPRIPYDPNLTYKERLKKQEDIKITNSVQNTPFFDITELTLIKTILEHPKYAETLYDMMSPDMFRFHAHELSLVLNKNTQDPIIRGILLNEEIKIFEEDEFMSAIFTFLINFYTNELNNIKRTNLIDFKAKSHIIRKIQNNIMELKKGNFVKFERVKLG